MLEMFKNEPVEKRIERLERLSFVGLPDTKATRARIKSTNEELEHLKRSIQKW